MATNTPNGRPILSIVGEETAVAALPEQTIVERAASRAAAITPEQRAEFNRREAIARKRRDDRRASKEAKEREFRRTHYVLMDGTGRVSSLSADGLDATRAVAEFILGYIHQPHDPDYPDEPSGFIFENGDFSVWLADRVVAVIRQGPVEPVVMIPTEAGRIEEMSSLLNECSSINDRAMELSDRMASQLTSLVESRAGAKTLTTILMWRDHPETMPRIDTTQFLAGMTMLNPRFVAGFLDAWEHRHPTNPSEEEYALGFVGGQNHADIEEALRQYKAEN